MPWARRSNRQTEQNARELSTSPLRASRGRGQGRGRRQGQGADTQLDPQLPVLDPLPPTRRQPVREHRLSARPQLDPKTPLPIRRPFEPEFPLPARRQQPVLDTLLPVRQQPEIEFPPFPRVTIPVPEPQLPELCEEGCDGNATEDVTESTIDNAMDGMNLSF